MGLTLNSGRLVADMAAMGAMRENALQAIRAKRYAEIMSHEQAHAAAAGGYGGGIVIEYDANHIAKGGHVPIHIPGLNPQSPESSLKAYQTIRGAALAPHSPSGQDMAVASMAQALMGKAQVLIAQKQQRAAKPNLG